MEHSEVSGGLTRGLRPSLGTIRLAGSYGCRLLLSAPVLAWF